MNDPDNKFPAAGPAKPLSPELAALVEKMSPATPEEIAAQQAGMLNYTPGPRQAESQHVCGLSGYDGMRDPPCPGCEARDARPVMVPQFSVVRKRMPYVSIDIETTGTDPSWCQVIEVGAVIEDWVTPVEQLPTFHCYVVHERTVGQPFALHMNAGILKKIADHTAKHGNRKYVSCLEKFLHPEHVWPELDMFLSANKIGRDRAILPAGKNFTGFDKLFLSPLLGFDQIKMHYRAIDPAMLFWNPDIDDEPPSTKTCMERAGIPGDVKHTAVEDARAVIQMVRAAFPQSPTPVKRSANEVAEQLTNQFLRNGQFVGQR
jgi:oligoribonuclease